MTENKDKKVGIGSYLICVLPLIIAFGFQMFFSALGALVAGVIATIDAAESAQSYEELFDRTYDAMMNGNTLLIITAVATLSTILLGTLWYRKYRPQTDLTIKQVVNGKLILVTVLLGMSMQLIISLCLNAVFLILPEETVKSYGQMMDVLIGGNVVLSVITTVILAPIAEEFLFRGVTMKMAKRVMPFMAANILQALCFGIYHGNLIQGTYAFVLGLVLGFTAEYFHSIWASVLLHACVNGAGQLLSLVPESLMGTVWGVILFATFGIVALFVAIRLFPGARKEPNPMPVSEIEQEKFTENSFDE